MDMSVPVPSLLLGLGGKCILNWALVFLQRDHIWSSFICVFSLSVSVIDTILTILVTSIHLLQDVNILGLRLGQYHVCMLVQILGYTYNAQHFGVLVLTLSEHLFTVWRRSLWKGTWILRLLLSASLWFCSVFYVVKISNVQPYIEDAARFQDDHCWIASSSIISETANLVGFCSLCFATWQSVKCGAQVAKNQRSNVLGIMKTQIKTRSIYMCKVIRVFLDIWVLLLLFLLLNAVLPLEMPSHLGLNCGWFCFLNSLFTAVALCVYGSGLELTAVPPDSFCDWRNICLSTINIHNT